MDIVEPRIDAYMRSLLDGHDEPVLLDMEAEGDRRDFPLVGRNVGVTLEVLARSIGARRVMELGSGFGYSAYWFARAVGPGGEVHSTDGSADNAAQAERYLTDAGLWDRVTFHVGDAVTQMNALDGDFDVVFCDIDKHGYPAAWRAASERIRPGGLWLCDNALGTTNDTVLSDSANAAAIREMNDLVAHDDRYVSTMIPTRQGLLVALRVG